MSSEPTEEWPGYLPEKAGKNGCPFPVSSNEGLTLTGDVGASPNVAFLRITSSSSLSRVPCSLFQSPSSTQPPEPRQRQRMIFSIKKRRREIAGCVDVIISLLLVH